MDSSDSSRVRNEICEDNRVGSGDYICFSKGVDENMCKLQKVQHWLSACQPPVLTTLPQSGFSIPLLPPEVLRIVLESLTEKEGRRAALACKWSWYHVNLVRKNLLDKGKEVQKKERFVWAPHVPVPYLVLVQTQWKQHSAGTRITVNASKKISEFKNDTKGHLTDRIKIKDLIPTEVANWSLKHGIKSRQTLPVPLPDVNSTYELSVGRSRTNDVSLLWDNQVSRFHIRIYRDDGFLCVRDCRQAAESVGKETKVNGVQLKRAAYLKNNDVIQLGHTTLKIEFW